MYMHATQWSSSPVLNSTNEKFFSLLMYTFTTALPAAYHHTYQKPHETASMASGVPMATSL